MTIKKTQNNIITPMPATQIISTAWRIYLSNFKEVFLASICITTIMWGMYTLSGFSFMDTEKGFIYNAISISLLLIVFISIFTCLLAPYDTVLNNNKIIISMMWKDDKYLSPKKTYILLFLLIIETIIITILNGSLYALLFFLYTVIESTYIIQIITFGEALTIASRHCWAIFTVLYFIFYICQLCMCFLQIPISGNEKINFVKVIIKSFKVATRNIRHFFNFTFVLTFLICGLVAYSFCIYFILNYLSYYFDLLDILNHYNLIIIIEAIIDFTIVAFISPLIMGSIIVYYYNHKAITEGYDLKKTLDLKSKNI